MMERTYLASVALSVVLVATAIGCKDEKVAGGPAGKVATLEGEANAVRGDESARQLAIGAVIFADDRITAAAKGSVTVTLDRNGASLVLANGASQVVSESPAWRAPRNIAASPLTEDVNDPSVAAGHEGTREAADRPEIASANTNTPDPKPKSEPGDGAVPVAASNVKASAGSTAADKKPETGRTFAKNQVRGSDKEKSDDSKDASGGEVKASQIQPRKNGKLLVVSVTPSSGVKAMERAARRRNHGVAVCLVDLEGKLSLDIRFSIAKDGTVTDLKLGGDTAKLSKEQTTCVNRSLGRSYDKALGGAVVRLLGSYR